MNTEYLDALVKLKKGGSYGSYVLAESDILNASETDLPELRIAVLRNYTVEMLTPVIIGEAAMMGFRPNVYIGGYDTVLQEVLDGNSQLYQFKPQIIILTLWLETLSPFISNSFPTMEKSDVEAEEKRIIDMIENCLTSIRRNTNAVVLINNFTLPGTSSLGIYDLQTENSQTQCILKINQMLGDIIKKQASMYLVDLLSIFYKQGYYNAFDTKMWAISKNPLSKTAMVALGKEYSKYIRTIKGNSKKCLVLDCDNTLWGGIVGECGTYGISLGDEYPGRCYKDLQKEILNLYHRGIFLTVCSKNNEEDVHDVFMNNIEMLIKEQHISAWQVNWNDKASNIVKIAESLNIGIDSLVFIDDNEFECNLITENLPEVAVIHLSGESSKYRYLLQDCGYFNSLTITEDDRKRNEMFRAETERKKVHSIALSVEDYLKSLQMKAEFFFNDDTLIPRIAQLTQKTNQFNLTTRRYTEEQIKGFIINDNFDVIAVKLDDKFSSLGIIGVSIIQYCNKTANIDTLLMSCRAIGRNVEDILMREICKAAKVKGCSRITGEYFATKKNSQVELLYKKYGLNIVSNNNSISKWEGAIENLAFGSENYFEVMINK